MSHNETIDELIEEAHVTAVEKGWWENNDRNVGELLCLMHSEISEALEEWRNGRALDEIYYNDGSEKPEGFPVEIADIFIRAFDLCKRYGVPLSKALRIKLDYNRTRPYRHGNKRA